YARLDAAAEAFGRGLLDAGVRHQEPVAFLLGNSWRFAASFFGCAKAGLVALPVNLMLAPEDIGWILAESGTRTVVADPAFVLPLFHTTALDTLLLPILLTGGTVILPGGFDPEGLLELVERRRATHLVLLPMMYGALLAAPGIRTRDLSSVQLCVYAMAPMPQ